MSNVEAKLAKGNLLKGGVDEYSQVIATDKSIPNDEVINSKRKAKVMNEELGLAQNVMKQTNPMRDLNQIVMMIMQGVSPEELITQGVPEELVMMAMQEISKETAQVPQEQAGLAAAAVKPLGR